MTEEKENQPIKGLLEKKLEVFYDNLDNAFNKRIDNIHMEN